MCIFEKHNICIHILRNIYMENLLLVFTCGSKDSISVLIYMQNFQSPLGDETYLFKVACAFQQIMTDECKNKHVHNLIFVEVKLMVIKGETWGVINQEIEINIYTLLYTASQVVLVVKSPPANARDIRDVGSIAGPGRSPGGRHGNPFQDSCLENPMDRGAQWATIHRVTKRHI